jgi:hypothetical protein
MALALRVAGRGDADGFASNAKKPEQSRSGIFVFYA